MTRSDMLICRVLYLVALTYYSWFAAQFIMSTDPWNLLGMAAGVFIMLLTWRAWEIMPPRLINFLDSKALAIAATGFGLHDSIQIIVEKLPDDVSAYYRREGAIHQIIVNDSLTPQEMSKAIYHEMTHAWQCERDFDGDGAEYHRATYWSTIEGAVDATGSFYEEEAEMMELLDYDSRLVTRGRNVAT